MKQRVLVIEAPDKVALVDFLTAGVTIRAEASTNKDGEPTIYVVATGCDDHCTILGEILAVIPEADKPD